MGFKRAAYGRSKKNTGSKIIDGVSNFGVSVVQVVYLRSGAYGYKKGRGRK